MAYTRYKGDPYWKRAKVGGTSADGTPYAKGDRVFFYPRSGATYAGDAASRASAEFDELASLEGCPFPPNRHPRSQEFHHGYHHHQAVAASPFPAHSAPRAAFRRRKLGRAPCRARLWPYV